MATDGLYSLDEIADHLAIGQVIARYVHALDARDYDTLDDVFLPDARFDLTEGGGIAGSWVEVKRYYQDGTPFHNSYVWVYEFHGDLIYRMTEHADTLLAHRAFHGVHPGR